MSGILAHEKIVPLVGMDSASRVQDVIRALAIVGCGSIAGAAPTAPGTSRR